MSGFVIQERDLEILKAVEAYRYLLTSQIKKLLFSDNSTHQSTRRRLRYLCQEDYLRRLTLGTSLSHLKNEFVYHIGSKGKIFLQSIGMELTPYPKKHVNPMFLTHTLEVSEFRINLELALKTSKKAQLDRFISEFELKGNFHSFDSKNQFKLFHSESSKEHKRYPVYPDALFIVKSLHSNYQELFFVEIDRGTVGLRKMLEKIIGYRLFIDSGNFSKKFPGFEDFIVLIQTISTQRSANIRKKISTDLGRDLVWITESSKVNEKTILSNIWTNGAGEQEYLVKE